jgi:serine/threonine-protein kinase HipA
VTSVPYPNAVTSWFLDGLLPEGAPRQAIAADRHLRADDTFGLISELGRDCAGALVIQPASDPPPASPTTAAAERLEPADLEELVSNLRGAPLGADRKTRVSLAGVQEKLVLTRMPDGAWGRPVNGAPSTHILKPELPEYPNTVENEAFCMRLAKHLGVPAAEVAVTTIGSRKMPS